MTEIKEYEEAREEIFKLLFPHVDVKRQGDCEMIDQILNVKGKNWRIAIIGEEEIDPSGMTDADGTLLSKVKIPKVIWQAGE